MNHLSHRLGIGFALLVVTLGACDGIKATDAFSALQISQVQVLDGKSCSVPGTATSLHRTHGVMDVGLPDSLFNDPPQFYPYWLPVLVVNNLSSAGGSKAEELNNIRLTHFTVELSAPNITWKSSCPGTFDTPTITDSLAPGGATGASLNIITAAHAQCLQSQVPPQNVIVTAKIVAKGRHGGTDIRSAEFTYPVEVCIGCLQTAYETPDLVPYRYPAALPMCSSLVGSNPYMGDTCASPGQDATIFCCALTITTGGADAGTAKRDVAVCPGIFTGNPPSDAGTTNTGP